LGYYSVRKYFLENRKIDVCYFISSVAINNDEKKSLKAKEMKIKDNCIVEISYKLNFVGEDDVIESFSERNPLEFLIGMGEMLPQFEEQLIGKQAGDVIDFTIEKENAFGEFNDNLVLELPISTFYDEQGKFNSDIVKEGAVITLDTDQKESQDAYVLEVTDENVLLDLNHPFAGEDLHYNLMILSVRLSE